MYFRFTTSYFNKQKICIETGIFRAADYVRDHTGIGQQEKKKLQELIDWFDNYLPVPEFYEDPAKRENLNTYFWYKATTDATVIQKMDQLVSMLEAHGVEVKRLAVSILPGTIVFEDEYQVAVNTVDKCLG
jgi:hypothetical protein